VEGGGLGFSKILQYRDWGGGGVYPRGVINLIIEKKETRKREWRFSQWVIICDGILSVDLCRYFAPTNRSTKQGMALQGRRIGHGSEGKAVEKWDCVRG